MQSDKVMKNVVIVAAGACCPIGFTMEEIFDSLRDAKAAVVPVSRFDTGRLKTGIGGETDLSAVIKGLGKDTISLPFLLEDLQLYENPKLAFALSACMQAITGQSSLSVPLPKWSQDIALFTTAGLEKVSVDALWHGADKDCHISREFPPTWLGEILSSLFSFTKHPPVTIVSACASSTQSIGEAARAVEDGTVEIALAGGTDSMLFPFGINAFNSIGALAEGHSKDCKLAPFDQNRTGTLLGEGSAYVLLTSQGKAEELGLKPLCQVVGYGSSLDGYHPVKPHPEGKGATAALLSALADGNVVPDEVDYVNAHGSGTYHNDIVEALVINEVFSKRAQQIPVSSTKPFYGHLLTAGGAIELLSLLFAFERNQIPPTLNLNKLDERCNLDCVDNVARSCKVDVAVSNSFGLHGQNGVLVLRAIENG